MEAFSIVALGAQSSGLLVITTSVPGPKDILEAGSTRSLVPPENPSEIAIAMEHYYDLWKRYGREY